ncbi:MAG: SRPBCC family protein [Actinomycetota bacterium]
MAKNRVVTVERVIPVAPQKIFDLLADPSMHPIIDGSGTVKSARERNPERLSLGARFGMGMRAGLPYRVTNKVVEFEDGKRIAWRHYGRHVWRYELEPVDGGTRVRESFDYRKAISPQVLELTGVPRKHVGNMEKTLERLEEHFRA